MNPTLQHITLSEALKGSSQTRRLEIAHAALDITPDIFRDLFAPKTAVVIADPATYRAAGQSVNELLNKAGNATLAPFLFSAPDLHAESRFVDDLTAFLGQHTAIPVAVGSGTINDLVKMASHAVQRPYICVATAASMDGYTAYGASITRDGKKQTFLCPAPLAVVADLDVICAAPGLLNSWGYADLMAKVPAGADWILADALGLDPIHPKAWSIVQVRIRELLADPAGVRNHDARATAKLLEGLMLGGFAIEAAKSTRAASGAEHLFSHMWDMQHHTHKGVVPSHGFKVAIGTLASTALYECILKRSIDKLDVDACCAAWPSLDTWIGHAREVVHEPHLVQLATEELTAKHVSPAQLRDQLLLLKSSWPGLRERLSAQLLPLSTLRQMLKDVGAPTEPEEIGISRARLRQTYWQASFIRRRFMILDVALRTGLMEPCLNEIFGPAGLWPA